MLQGRNIDEELAMASPHFVRLANRPGLVDSWQRKYLHAGDIYKLNFRALDLQVAGEEETAFVHPEHHPDAFYQGEKKPAKVIFVGGTYRLGAHPETGFKVWERFGNRARLVDMTGDIKRSKFYLPGISSRHVWDWRIIVCGSEVDVEDALRFACSLFVHNEGAGAPSSRYFDFWSLGSGQRLNNGDGTTLGEHQLENRIQVLRSRVLDLEIESDDMEAKVNDLEMENERLRKRIAELEGTGSGELESAPGAGSGGQSPKRSRSNGDDGPGRKRQR